MEPGVFVWVAGFVLKVRHGLRLRRNDRPLRHLERALGTLRGTRRDSAVGGRHRLSGPAGGPEGLLRARGARRFRLYRGAAGAARGNRGAHARLSTAGTSSPAGSYFCPAWFPGLHLAARHLVPADGHVLVPTPIYHHFKRAVQLAPREHSDVPLVLSSGRWVLDEDRLAQAVRRDTKLLFLCNPQNPGGTIFNPRRTGADRVVRGASRSADLLR